MRMTSCTAAALAFALGMSLDAQSAMSAGWDDVNGLARAAYFSDECRHESATLGIAGRSDASGLIAAFAGFGRQRAGGPGADPSDARHATCTVPAVLLINLLRLEGVAAELVVASMPPANAAPGAPSDEIARLFVYVPALDRYVDPAAPLAKHEVLDRIIRENASRTHVVGPSLDGARSTCRTTCLHVYTPRREASVRVKTEVIRGR